jgi:hypothetical protein
VQRSVERHLRKIQLLYAIRMHQPLPDGLREANYFQRIARSAQDRYQPSGVDLPIVVYRAEGLYYEPALGWDEYSNDVLACFEVPGAQSTPRHSMMEPCVGSIVEHLGGLLTSDLPVSQAAGPVRSVAPALLDHQG